MTTFLRKPEIVQATRYTEDGFDEKLPWIENCFRNGILQSWERGQVILLTHHGTEIFRPGDWIVRNGEGDLSRSSADLFHLHYERVR